MFGAIVTSVLLSLYSIVAMSSPYASTPTLPETIQAVSVADSPTEDSPMWDCRTDGNRICGPTGGQHAPGLYRDGVLLEPGTVMVRVWDEGMYATPPRSGSYTQVQQAPSGGWH